MIRIDLGKPEAKSGAGSSISDLLGRLQSHLPKQIQEKLPKSGSKDWKDFAAIGIAAAVALLPYLFVSQYKSYVKSQHELQMASFREKENQVNVEITRFKSFQRELESYEKQKKLIRERLQVVKLLLEARNTPVSVFDAIGQSLPEKTWLSTVELKVAPKATISISGQAYSNEDISDYVDKLSESIQLKDVNLENVISSKGENGMDVKQFSIAAVPAGQLQANVEAPRETAGQPDAAGAKKAPKPVDPKSVENEK